MGKHTRFSQRMGLEPVKVDIQKKAMDGALRSSLWNALKLHYFDKVETDSITHSIFKPFFIDLWANYFKLPLDSMDDY